MNNYPDNVRYEGDTSDPRSPFYEEQLCPRCGEPFDYTTCETDDCEKDRDKENE